VKKGLSLTRGCVRYEKIVPKNLLTIFFLQFSGVLHTFLYVHINKNRNKFKRGGEELSIFSKKQKFYKTKINNLVRDCTILSCTADSQIEPCKYQQLVRFVFFDTV
jgi:hypothetical protein